MVTIAVDGGGLMRMLDGALSLLRGHCAYRFDVHMHLHFLDLRKGHHFHRGLGYQKLAPPIIQREKAVHYANINAPKCSLRATVTCHSPDPAMAFVPTSWT